MESFAGYHYTESKNGKGTFFLPTCCNKWIYSINNEYAYHGKLCPICFAKGIYTTLYLCGTKEWEENVINSTIQI